MNNNLRNYPEPQTFASLIAAMYSLSSIKKKPPTKHASLKD